MGAPAMQLLRDVAVDKQRWVQRALRKLSVGLMRGNAWNMKAGLVCGLIVRGVCFRQASRGAP